MIKLKKNQRIISFILILLFFITIITAANAADNDDITTSDIKQVDTQHNYSAEYVSHDVIDKSSDIIKNSTDKSKVNKTTNKYDKKTKITKKSTTYDVDNYLSLENTVNTIKNSTDTEATINLNPGDYNITNTITWGDSQNTKTLTINGNNNIINGDGQHQFITVAQGYTLNLKNIVINNTDKAVINQGNTSIENSNFTNNIAVNHGVIYNEATFSMKNTNIINSSDNDGCSIYSLNNITVENSTINTITPTPKAYTSVKIVSPITLKSLNADEDVIFNIDGKTFMANKNMTDNTVSINYVFMMSGDKTITINYPSLAGAMISVDVNDVVAVDAIEINTIDDVKVFNKTTVNGKLLKADGTLYTDDVDVVFKIGDKIYKNTTINGGIIDTILDTEDLMCGQYDVILNAGVENQTQLNIIKRNSTTSIALNTTTPKTMQNIKITATVVDEFNETPKGGSVTFKVDGVEIATVDVTDKTIEYDYILPSTIMAGDHEITAQYTSTDSYNPSENKETINIQKTTIADTQIVLDSIKTQNNITVDVVLNDEFNHELVGNVDVEVLIDNTSVINTTIVNGQLNTQIPTDTLKSNNYSVVFNIHENGLYNAKTLTSTLEVINRKVTIDPIVVNNPTTLGELKVDATITDELGENVQQGIVIFKLDGVEIGQANVAGGRATITYTLPASIIAGQYNIKAEYSSDKYYNQANANTTVNVERSIIADVDLSQSIKTRNNATVNTILKDIDGKTLTGNVDVEVLIDDQSIQNLTIKDGVVNLVLPMDEKIQKNYTLTIKTKQNNLYDAKTLTSTIEVVNREVIIESIDVNTPRTTQDLKVNTTIKDEFGNPLNDGIATFKLDGVEIGQANVAGGRATITYTLPYDVFGGDHKVTVEYAADKYYDIQSKDQNVEVVKSNIKSIVIPDKSIKTKLNTTIGIALRNEYDKSLNTTVEVDIYIDSKLLKTRVVPANETTLILYLPFENASAGVYLLDIRVRESGLYNAINTTATINVINRVPIIEIETNTPRTTGVLEINTTIKDNDGNIVNQGVIIFSINGVNITDAINVTNGHASANVTLSDDTQARPFTLVAKFVDPQYAVQHKTKTINIIRSDIADVIIPKIETKALTNTTYDIILKDTFGKQIIHDSDVEVIFTGENNTYRENITISNGVLHYELPTGKYPPGLYNVTFNVKQNNYYNEKTINSQLEIIKRNATINITTNNPKTVQTMYIRGKLVDDDGVPINNGKAVIKVDGRIVRTLTVRDGEVQYSYRLGSNIYAGEHNISIEYINDYYNTKVENSTFNVIRSNLTDIIIPLREVKTGGTTGIDVVLRDELYQQLLGASEVEIFVDGVSVQNLTVKNGLLSTTIPIGKEEIGEADIVVKVKENGLYNEKILHAKATIDVRRTTINIETNTPKTTQYLDINITIRDDNGTLVDSGVVIFKFESRPVENGEGTYVASREIGNITVVDGKAHLSYKLTNDISAQSYTLTVEYIDDVYQSQNKTQIVTVIHSNLADLTIPDITIKTLTNGNIYTEILDEHGQYPVGTLGAHTIIANNESNYQRIVDSVMDLEIYSESLKEGEYEYIIHIYGNGIYNSKDYRGKLIIVNSTSTIEVTSNIPKTMQNLQAEAIVKDTNGTILKDGEVIFKLDGVEVATGMIRNGKAKISYRLPTTVIGGEHKLTAELHNEYYDINSTDITVNVLKTDIKDMDIPSLTIKTLQNSTIDIVIDDEFSTQLKENVDVEVFIDEKSILNTTTNMAVLDVEIPIHGYMAGVHNITYKVKESNLYNTKTFSNIISLINRVAKLDVTTNTPKTTQDLIINITATTDNDQPVEDANITIHLGNDVIGTVRLINGTAQLIYTLPPNKTARDHPLIVEFSAEYYIDNSITKSVHIIRSDLSEQIVIPTQEIRTLTNTTINMQINDSVGKKAAGIINGEMYINSEFIKNITIVEGIFDVDVEMDGRMAGEYDILVKTIENDLYNAVEFGGKINIVNRNASIKFNTNNPKTTEQLTIQSTITDDIIVDRGDVTFKLNGNTIGVIKVINGTANMTYQLPPEIVADTYEITAQYTNEYYNTNTTSKDLEIKRSIIKDVIIPQQDRKVWFNTPIDVILHDMNNKQIIKTTDIEVLVDGISTYNTTIENGNLKITVPTDTQNTGLHNITIIAKENGLYEQKTIQTTVNIVKRNTTIEITKINNTQTLRNLEVNTKITDSEKQPASEGRVVFKLDGNIIGTVDVVNGTANLTYMLPHDIISKDYNITVEYSADDNYNSNMTSKVVNIRKSDIQNLTIPTQTIETQNNITIDFMLNDSTGAQLVEQTDVEILLDGKSYKNLTITDGVLKTNVTMDELLKGQYTITIKLKENGLYNGKTFTAKVNIINRNGIVTIVEINDPKTMRDLIINTTVIDIRGDIVDQGVVTFKLDGIVIGTADVVNGTANLTYMLPHDIFAGAHRVVAEFNDKYYNTNTTESETNVIKSDINDVVIPDVTMKTLNTIPVDITLNDEFARQLVDESSVEILINGTSYKNFTITGGALKVDIPTDKLLQGTYTVTINIKENGLYNAKTITTTVNIENRDATLTITQMNNLTTLGNLIINTTVVDADGNITKRGVVTFKLDGKIIGTANVVDGKAGLTYTLPADITVGSYDVDVEFSDPYYNNAENSGIINVSRSTIADFTIPTQQIKTQTNATIDIILKDTTGKQLVGQSEVEILVNGESIKTLTINNGVLNTTFKMDERLKGEYTVTVKVKENGLYNTKELTTKVDVINRNATVEINTNTPKTMRNLTINTKIIDADGSIINRGVATFKLDGNVIGTINVVDGSANLTYTLPHDIVAAKHNIEVEFKDQYYNDAVNTKDVDVLRCDIADVVIPEITIKTQQNITIDTILNDEFMRSIVGESSVEILVDGLSQKNITITDGVLNTNVVMDELLEGEHIVTINIKENGLYNAKTITTKVTIEDRDAKITIDKINNPTTLGNLSINTTVIDTEGKIINQGVVIFKLDGRTIATVDVVNGSANMTYTLPSEITAGNYTVDVIFTDKYYSNSTANATTSITRSTISDVVIPDTIIKTQQNTTIENITLTDINGQPLSGKSDIEVYVDGKVVLEDIIVDGKVNFTLKTDTLYQGNYTITIKVKENGLYAEKILTSNLTVINRDAIIKIKDINSPHLTEKLLINTTVVDTDGNKLNEGFVIFKINGKTLKDEQAKTVTVNVTNGVANLEYILPLSIGGGKYDVVAYYKNPYYNDANNTSKLTITKYALENVTMDNIEIKTYSNATINMTVKDQFGRTLITNTTVTIKINGKTFTKTVIQDGKLNITLDLSGLSAKNYTIDVVYGENGIYYAEDIKANLTVINRNVNIKINTQNTHTHGKLPISAVVRDDDGNLVKNGSVIVKINGQTIRDEDGNAIKYKVVDGIVMGIYQLPNSMSARNYNITFVYSNKGYNRGEETSTFTVEKTNVSNINITSITVKPEQNTTIRAMVYDEYDMKLIGNTKIAVKVDGKTIIEDTMYDGKLKISFKSLTIGAHKLSIICGANSFYNEKRFTIPLIVNSKKGINS